MNMLVTMDRPISSISLAAVFVFLFLISFGEVDSHAGEGSLSKATFYVY